MNKEKAGEYFIEGLKYWLIVFKAVIIAIVLFWVVSINLPSWDEDSKKVELFPVKREEVVQVGERFK